MYASDVDALVRIVRSLRVRCSRVARLSVRLEPPPPSTSPLADFEYSLYGIQTVFIAEWHELPVILLSALALLARASPLSQTLDQR